MRRTGLVGLCLVAAFAIGSAGATQALAAEYIYRVEGKKLGAGATRELTAKARTEFIVKDVGSKAEVKCKKVKLNAAEKPVIVGGTPGTSEKESFEFEECSATLEGAKCSSATVETAVLNNELVTVVKPAGEKGDLGFLFTPASGKIFMTIKLKSCGIFGSQEVKAEGTSTALVSLPQKTETAAVILVWSESEPITEIMKQNGVTEKTGLASLTLNGEVELELVSKEKWGVF